MKTGITKVQTKVESTQLKTSIVTTLAPAHCTVIVITWPRGCYSSYISQLPICMRLTKLAQALKGQPIIRKSIGCLANY